MDQLHEELKQPIIEEEDDREESELPELQCSPVIGHRNPDGQISLDTSSTSSQSDYDYETCDSAIGSEKENREANGSSDENSDINEFSRLNLSGNSYDLRSNVRQGRRRSGNLKDKKDSVNKTKKNADNISICSDDQRSDSGEFVDAESEPRNRRQRWAISGSTEKEREPLARQSNKQKSNVIYSVSQGMSCKCAVNIANKQMVFNNDSPAG